MILQTPSAKARAFRKLDNSGTIAIEFAFLMPIFLVLALGIIEYGMWFFESEITTSSVSNISQAIQRNPNITAAQLQQMVTVANEGLSRISFTNGKNYICVKAYTSAGAAQRGGCQKGDMSASNPPANAGNTYAVVVDAYVAPNSLTPLGNFIHTMTPTALGINQKNVSTVGDILPPKACLNTTVNGVPSYGIVQFNPTANPPYSCAYIPIPPSCTGAGFAMQYNANLPQPWVCANLFKLPNGKDCSQPWEKLAYDSNTNTFACQRTPFVFAGGIVHPSTLNGNSFWDGTHGIAIDSGHAPWIPTPDLPYSTICQHITFTVPANLPGGQVVAQGNLIYPGASNDGNWHDWVVSFVHLDTGPTPPTGPVPYQGSADMCMASGGNYGPYSPLLVNSENASWTIIFIPN